MTKIVLLVLSLFFAPLYEVLGTVVDSDVILNPPTAQRVPLYKYGYPERDHSVPENLKNLGIMYGLTWVVYPVFQPKVFKGSGGWGDYKRNFGQLVFDKDEPIWNFFVHPISGSQLYLLYRADGYTRMESFGMTFITSALFEFTVEVFTEPASVQDLYQTPILGTVLGLGIENFSMYLLNTGTYFGKFFGHLLNPATLLPIYQGRTLIIPKIEEADKGAMVKVEVDF